MSRTRRGRLLTRVVETLHGRLGVDPRALAALRVSLGLLVLADLALRARDLTAFYTDVGVLPRSLLVELYPTVGRLSLYTLSGAAAWQATLFAVTAAVAVALVVGYRSRLAALLLFVLLLSLHTRNLAVLNAGDSLLRRLLLWGALLPLGARWSLNPDAGSGTGRVVSLATAGMLAQVVAVYVVNAVVKLRGEAWPAGTAVRYVFGMDALTTELGALLAGKSALLAIGTYAWLGLVVAAPLLFVVTGWRRTALVAAFAGGHLFMFATLELGIFPFVSLAGLLSFLPSTVWDRLEAVLADARVRPVTVQLGRPDSGRPLLGRADRPVTRTVAALLFVFVLVWNAAAVGVVAVPAATASVDPEERRWDMFAPEPHATDAWYVPVGTTTDGKQVDALRGSAPAFEVKDPGTTYPTHRWYVYLTDLRRTPGLRPGLVDYLCTRWNRTHTSNLVKVDLIVVTQSVRLGAPDPTDRRSVGNYDC